MRRVLRNRIRAGKAFVSLLLGTNTLFGTITPSSRQASIGERVAVVRASLAQNGEQRNRPSGLKKAEPKALGELAQWSNWPNWGNWNNWNNWRNWNNWANWSNWRNF